MAPKFQVGQRSVVVVAEVGATATAHELVAPTQPQPTPIRLKLRRA
jgi:hypothetical protein